MEIIKDRKNNGTVKKDILQVVKYLDNYDLRVVVFSTDNFGDVFHQLEVNIYSNDEYVDSIEHSYIKVPDEEGTWEQNLNEARKTLAPFKKKLVKYLKEHFNDVIELEDCTQ